MFVGLRDCSFFSSPHPPARRPSSKLFVGPTGQRAKCSSGDEMLVGRRARREITSNSSADEQFARRDEHFARRVTCLFVADEQSRRIS
jgi:hypothetical protein